MNYRHIYHAGNFADVFKHWILSLLLQKMLEKPSPFCVIDTHAGLGRYNLHSVEAQKTQEYMTGIELLLRNTVDPEFTAYVDIVTQKKKYHVYPGSPTIIQEHLRAADRAFLVEMHPEDCKVLTENFRNDHRIKVLQKNGYGALKALLPPKERRGIVFIDPPFEELDEFKHIVAALGEALKRFEYGVYAIWYPITDATEISNFYAELSSLPIKNSCYIELHAPAAVTNQLVACGIVLINAPWKFSEQMTESMPKLLHYLQLDKGYYRFGWLK